MDKSGDQGKIAGEINPPNYNSVCPITFEESEYFPSITLKIRTMIENLEEEEKDENFYKELVDRKAKEKKNKKEDWEIEMLAAQNMDPNAINYDKIVATNLDNLKELNQEILEISNCITIIFNEIEIITANPNIHGIGKVYKMTYFVKNYIPVIKNKFKEFRNKHYDDQSMERIRAQVYFSLKLYFEIAYEYVIENYELKMGELIIEDFEEKIE